MLQSELLHYLLFVHLTSLSTSTFKQKLPDTQKYLLHIAMDRKPSNIPGKILGGTKDDPDCWR